MNKTNITALLDTAYVKHGGNWYECDDTYCALLKNKSQIVVSLTQTHSVNILFTDFYRVLMLIYFSMKL